MTKLMARTTMVLTFGTRGASLFAASITGTRRIIVHGMVNSCIINHHRVVMLSHSLRRFPPETR
jgi:hypothetical protein